MLTTFVRPALGKIFLPLAKLCIKLGITPDMISIFGAAGIIASCLTLVISGHIFTATLVITAFALTDSLDGLVARTSGRSSSWGAFLDSTLDRLSDGFVFGSFVYWLFTTGYRIEAILALSCLVTGFLVSYIRARAEGLSIACTVGFAERTERLIILGLGGLGHALSIPYSFLVTLAVLLALSLFTCGQRMRVVYLGTKSQSQSVAETTS